MSMRDANEGADMAVGPPAGYREAMTKTPAKAPALAPAPASTGADDWAQSAEARLLDAAIGLVPSEGWSLQAIHHAARAAGLSAADADLLLPGGPRDLAALFWGRHDRATLYALREIDPRSLKMRERITRAVQARVEAAAADEAAARRCAGFLALPGNLPLGLRLLWDSADTIWRWAGDEAVDENHYSKRAILSGVLGPALALRLSQGREASDHYVFRRINDVMTFEKWKAALPKAALGAQIAGALGRLRYGR
jgi:ubiquinone biosynthesis protein COQ9